MKSALTILIAVIGFAVLWYGLAALAVYVPAVQFFHLLLYVFAAPVIYWDATGRKIGRNKEKKAFLNLSAGGWGACSVLLFIVALPAYLVKREELIQLAAQNPVTVSKTHRIIVTLVLLAASVGLLSLRTLQPKAHEGAPVSQPVISDTQ